MKKTLFALYFLLCFAANVWPIATYANRIEPMVLGLPFFFFWGIMWVVLVFIGVLAMYLSENSVNKEQ